MSAPRRGLELKRALDVVFALATLPFFLPLLALLGLAIKLTSRGPVFFFQERAGLHGQPLQIWKFRTMTVDPNRDVNILAGTSEITAVGKLLHATSLDELPQLINILNGTMSLIGPRPTLPEQVAKYDDF